MAKGKLIGYGVILFLVLLLVAWHFYWTRGIYVRITNDTWTTLENVTIACWQDVVPVGTLKPRVSRAQYVNPSGESDLTLEWFEPSGVRHSHPLGVYIETNCAGSIDIIVLPGNRVAVTNTVKLRVIDRSTRSRTDLLREDANAMR